MKINKARIKALKPCKEGYTWYLNHGSEDLLDTLLRVNKYELDYAIWLINKLTTRKQRLELNIFCAQQVLHVFENKYPNDKSIQLAIKTAKKVLKNTKKNCKHAYYVCYYKRPNYTYSSVSQAAFNTAYNSANSTHPAYNIKGIQLAINAINNEKKKRQLQEKIIRKAVKILDK